MERGLNVNKKKILATAGSVFLALGAFGCSGGGGKTYSYKVTGTVEAAHIDYECGDSLSMEPVGFNAGRGGGSSSGGSRSGGSGTSGGSKGRGTVNKDNSSSSVQKDSKRPASTGVRLTKKPDKPERVSRVEVPAFASKPKGCKEEYELFVRNRDGLFEQDVRKVDYERCSDKAREKFPACTATSK